MLHLLGQSLLNAVKFELDFRKRAINPSSTLKVNKAKSQQRPSETIKDASAHPDLPNCTTPPLSFSEFLTLRNLKASLRSI